MLKAAQVTAFFESSTQMVITHEAMIQLKSEGIDVPEGLAYFDEG